MRREAGANVSLPLLTIFLASDAKTLGAFGLVAGGFTNRYQPPDLGQTFELATFTNTYRRDQGTGYRLTYA